jgi:hypothetical protein
MKTRDLAIVCVTIFVGMVFIPISMFMVQPTYESAPYSAQTNTMGIIYFSSFEQTPNPLVVNVNEYYKPSFLSYELVKEPVGVIIGEIRTNDKR